MQMALNEAKKAYKKMEVPVGAIIVKKNKIISRSHNEKEIKNDPLGHAEIIAIRKASKKINHWRLNDCEIYVTLEPCAMCAGAILQSRIAKLYFGTKDYKSGAVVSITNLLDIKKFNHNVLYEYGIYENECSKILKTFFKELRNSK